MSPPHSLSKQARSSALPKPMLANCASFWSSSEALFCSASARAALSSADMASSSSAARRIASGCAAPASSSSAAGRIAGDSSWLLRAAPTSACAGFTPLTCSTKEIMVGISSIGMPCSCAKLMATCRGSSPWFQEMTKLRPSSTSTGKVRSKRGGSCPSHFIASGVYSCDFSCGCDGAGGGTGRPSQREPWQPLRNAHFLQQCVGCHVARNPQPPAQSFISPLFVPSAHSLLPLP
mmetsp:Transcript_20654/g.43974  ORF Transcript_20654/g.43974 Transcript_20654/m.43974 type:complete len:235 (+) Transcript_20654:140-844(+)